MIEFLVDEQEALKRILKRSRGIDDDPNLFKERMRVYFEEIKEIREYYNSQNKYLTFRSEHDISESAKKLKSIMMTDIYTGKHQKNIILVTFDIHRIEYPTMSYSIASILATMKNYNIPASHHSFNIDKFVMTKEGHMPIDVLVYTDEIVEYLKKFSYIALGITRWSELFAYMLIRKLDGYRG